MSKLDTLKCLLGRHDFSRWRLVGTPLTGSVKRDGVWQPRVLARQRRFCHRCGTAQTRPYTGRPRWRTGAGPGADSRETRFGVGGSEDGVVG